MSIVSNNIKYLRRLNGLTQEQFARKIAIKRSLLGAYEEARANPNLTNLKNMAAAFGISVDQLLKNDLRKLRETPDMSLPLSASRPMTVSHSGQASATRVPVMNEPQPLSKIIEKFQPVAPEIRTVSRQVNLKPVSGEIFQTNLYEPAPETPAPSVKPKTEPYPAQNPEINTAKSQIPVFNNQYQPQKTEENSVRTEYPLIQWVAAEKQSEYLVNHQNPYYLNSLPSFQLPNLSPAYYRGFESADDFPLAGSILIGTFVRNWFDIQTGKQYLFVLHNHGIVFRKAVNQVKERGLLILTSDMASIPAFETDLNEVLEVWEIKAFVSTQLPSSQPNLDRVSELLTEAKREIDQIRN